MDKHEAKIALDNQITRFASDIVQSIENEDYDLTGLVTSLELEVSLIQKSIPDGWSNRKIQRVTEKLLQGLRTAKMNALTGQTSVDPFQSLTTTITAAKMGLNKI
jgi:hypothetical protein